MGTPRSKLGPNACRGVRVVGRIRPLLDPEAAGATGADPSVSPASCSQMSVSRVDGEYALISFGEQANGRKESYKLDWCYAQNEGVGEVFEKEVKPLLEGVLNGHDGCVIAYGAQGSGKTRLIQGSEENPGLALMAISEMLPAIENLGGLMSIACYEVRQDRIYDLLEPKEQEVLVMEDASRRIQLKGLSQTPIKSVSDFVKSYFHRPNVRKPLQNGTSDAAVRSHRGLIVYVSYVDKESNNPQVGRLNIVDLAGYEDVKRNGLEKPVSAEIVKVNKSLHALLDVVYALNSGEAYIPYRRTKLTHLLQEFFSRASGAVLLTCLNQTPCQDTIYAVSLASRSCQVVNKHWHDSAKNNKSSSKFAPPCSPLNKKIQSLNASVKKLEVSQSPSVEKNGKGSSSITKRRFQLLDASDKKYGTPVNGLSERKANTPSSRKEGRMVYNSRSSKMNSQKVTCALDTPNDNQHRELEGNVTLTDELNPPKADDTGSSITDEPPLKDIFEENMQHEFKEDIDICHAADLELEINDARGSPKQTPSSEHGPSPTITEKLREISNSLRLASSKPIISMSTPLDTPCKSQVPLGSLEPTTPGPPVYFRLESKLEEMATPQDILKARSTGLKKSLLQECLTFLNNASREELKALRGIGDKRASYILALREETLEPFKKMEDLKRLGLNSKQIREMMSELLGDF